MKPRKRDMYRFPWSMNDNPIGWLEITDTCNIYCKGCYRQNLTGHRPLDEVKRDVDFFKEWRNCDNISIAGGEPLIYPDILDLVAYIRQQGMKPLILTNGVALTPEFTRELKKAGALGFTFHIDSSQRRPGHFGKTEAELCEVRQHYAEMVAEVGGMFASFGATIYHSNLHQIPEIVAWATKNIDIVHGLVFITYRGVPEDEAMVYAVGDTQVDASDDLSYASANPDEIDIKSTDVYAVIKERYPHYETCAYLGGSASHESIKWLIGVQIGSKGGHMYGSIGPKAMEIAQVAHHLFQGTYFAYTHSHKIGKKLFLAALVDKQVRQAFRAFMSDLVRHPGRLFRPVYVQSIGIVQAPDVLEDGRADMCDSCPDMTVWEGKLINSCRMDEFRLYGTFITVQKGVKVESAIRPQTPPPPEQTPVPEEKKAEETPIA